MEKITTSEVIARMEEINMKLEFIEATLKVYAAGFEDSAMLSKVNSLEISNALYSTYELLQEQRNDLESLIGLVLRSNHKEQSNQDA